MSILERHAIFGLPKLIITFGRIDPDIQHIFSNFQDAPNLNSILPESIAGTNQKFAIQSNCGIGIDALENKLLITMLMDLL